MKTTSIDSKNQPQGAKRRGFLKAFGIATAGAAVAAAVAAPVRAAPALTDRQRTMLEHFDQLNDVAQLQLIRMAENLIQVLPRNGAGMAHEKYVESLGVKGERADGDRGVLDRLDQQERSLIQAFREMDERARRSVTRIARRNATEWPRNAVAGGTA